MTPVPQSRASGAVRLWRCPECKAEAFWPAEPPLPGGPALCDHPSSGYVSALYVPAVLSEDIARRGAEALAIFSNAYRDPEGPQFEGTAEDYLIEQASRVLRAAGFVSEPSTGGE